MRPRLSCFTMRPLYERTEDRAKQRELIAFMRRERPDLRCVETIPQAPYDFAFMQHGKIVAIVEVKARQCAMHRFAYYMIGSTKVDTLRELARETPCAAYLLVGWPDGVGLLHLGERIFRRSRNGRHDRNDPQDMELCEFIPLTAFRTLHRVK